MIEVTTLADSGLGSLRAAINAEGPRTVVFRVAGTIKLASELRVRHPFITIAGQSAPGDGITLRDHTFVIAADEVIVRYIRVRLGDESRTVGDAMWLAEGRNIVVDHVSTSWSVDETLSVSHRVKPGALPLDNVTVQWSIIAESLDQTGLRDGAHGFGSLVRGAFGARYTFHHNLWAHHRARMPRPGNYESAASDSLGPLMDFRNNVFYNWGGGHSGYNQDGDAVSRYNFVANYYVRGPNSGAKSVAFREESLGARAFFSHNWMDGLEPADPWSLVRVDSERPNYRAAAPFETAAVTTERSDIAYGRVIASAGASLIRDAVDQRVIESVRLRTGRIINSQADVGGWPALREGTSYADSDYDGMSDVWERTRGLDPHDDRDGAADRDRDGYTNLEEFLNGLVASRN